MVSFNSEKKNAIQYSAKIYNSPIAFTFRLQRALKLAIDKGLGCLCRGFCIIRGDNFS